MIGAVLFTWLQGAEFYRDLHKKAVDCIPLGDNKTWLDLGCGPGLVSRQAAENNYDVIGIDTDSAMINAARRIAKWHGSKAKFEVGDLSFLSGRQTDVVSAASLLAVLSDKRDALRIMWDSVRPGGYLLIIEPTELMSPKNAQVIIKSRVHSKRISGLKLWAKARENLSIDPGIFSTLNSEDNSCIDLLDGMVKAWVFKKGE